MAIMKDKTWERHSNPWSVRTRVLTYPLVYLPVWNRTWLQALSVGAWFCQPPIVPASRRRLVMGDAQRTR